MSALMSIFRDILLILDNYDQSIINKYNFNRIK